MRWVGVTKERYKEMASGNMEARARNVKKECFGRHRDYKIIVLRDSVRSRIAFNYYRDASSEIRSNMELKKKRKGPRFWANRECFACSAKESLHIHHIVPVCQGGPNHDWNLINLCIDCHSDVHKKG